MRILPLLSLAFALFTAPGPKDAEIPALAPWLSHTATISKALRPRMGLNFDAFYVLPGRLEFAEMLDWCLERQTKGYIDDAWDCDDKGREFWVNACKWSRSHYKDLPAALGVGLAYCHVNGFIDRLGDYDDTMHVLGVVELADHRVLFIEPASMEWSFAEWAIYEGTVEVIFVEL